MYIDWGEVILRIREKATSFENRVGGSSEFVALREQDDPMTRAIGLPSCFVIPEGRTAEPREGDGEHQDYIHQFSTYIIVDNTPVQQTGNDLQPIQEVEKLIYELQQALLGYQPTSVFRTHTVEYVLDQHVEMKDYRLWHQVIWQFRGIMDSEEIPKCPEGVPISNICFVADISGNCDGFTGLDTDDYTCVIDDECVDGDGLLP